MRLINLTHKNCNDGFAASWVLLKYLEATGFLFGKFPVSSVIFVDDQYTNGRTSQEVVNLIVDAVKPYEYMGSTPKLMRKKIESDLKKDILLITDFSYSPEIMADLRQRFYMIIMIDHHATARDNFEGTKFSDDFDLEDWTGFDWLQTTNRMEDLLRTKKGPKLFSLFDMKRSGSKILFDLLFAPGANQAGNFRFEIVANARSSIQEFVEYINDRDMFTFNNHLTRKFHSYLTTVPRTHEAWDLTNSNLHHSQGNNLVMEIGQSILEATQVRINNIINAGFPFVDIKTPTNTWEDDFTPEYYTEIPYINCEYAIMSDLGAALVAKGHKFVIMYTDGLDERNIMVRKFSLRSNGKINVAAICQDYGGGGHAGAAGFAMDLHKFMQANVNEGLMNPTIPDCEGEDLFKGVVA